MHHISRLCSWTLSTPPTLENVSAKFTSDLQLSKSNRYFSGIILTAQQHLTLLIKLSFLAPMTHFPGYSCCLLCMLISSVGPLKTNNGGDDGDNSSCNISAICSVLGTIVSILLIPKIILNPFSNQEPEWLFWTPNVIIIVSVPCLKPSNGFPAHSM